MGSENYLLSCYRYIEINPVRARMVAAPDEYAWSSFASNALGKRHPMVRPHASYLALGVSPDTRRSVYRNWVMQQVDTGEIDAIRLHLQRQHAHGSNRFRAVIEAQLGRRAGPAKIGRPQKQPLTSESAT